MPRRLLDQFTPHNALAAECRALILEAHVDYLWKDHFMFQTHTGTVYTLAEAQRAIQALEAAEADGYTYHLQGHTIYTIGVYDADRLFVGEHSEET